jgi:hypothetical protein
MMLHEGLKLPIERRRRMKGLTLSRTLLMVALLVFLIFATNYLLNLGIMSFTLTSLLLALTTILLIRMIFKTSTNVASWFPFERVGKLFRPVFIEKKASVVKEATRNSYYSRKEIAHVLRAALACRFGDQSKTCFLGSTPRESMRNELVRLVGRNERVLEILDPREDKCRRRRFRTRSLQEEEEYMSGLEEVIKILNERGSE